MAGSIRNTGVALAVAAALAACAPTATQPDPGAIRQFRCDDGTSFSAEVTPMVVRMYTPTGIIELPRQRGADPPYFTNGLRAVVLDDDGTVRHAVGRRAWARCEVR